MKTESTDFRIIWDILPIDEHDVRCVCVYIYFNPLACLFFISLKCVIERK